MRIAINVNELTLDQNTGVKIYTAEILRALSGIDGENHYILYSASKLPEIYGKNFENKVVKTSFPFWTYTKLPVLAKKDKPDIFFMPIQSTPFWKKPEDIKLVVTVHDVAFRIFPDYFTAKDRLFLNFHTKRAIEMSDAIIVPSEATKWDVLKFYGVTARKINIIHHGISQNIAKSDFQRRSDIGEKYILFVGTVQPRKNIANLIRAFEKIKDEATTVSGLRLVICGGRGWMADSAYETAKKSKYRNDIIFAGNVSAEELAGLYKDALLFVLPSLYEGFGLPLLEAMNFGLPCVVSNNSSLSEIAGNAALFVDPYDISDIAKKIKSVLDDDSLRMKYCRKSVERAKDFSWVKSAEMHLKVFQKIG